MCFSAIFDFAQASVVEPGVSNFLLYYCYSMLLFFSIKRRFSKSAFQKAGSNKIFWFKVQFF